ncbi:19024_t:CDS:2, partial [Racocetra fulgida]
IKNSIEHFGEKEWHNWGENQQCTPAEIFRPVNLHDLKLTLKVEPMFNLMMIDRFPKISDYWKPANLKNDVLNSDSIEIFYWPFNTAGFEENNDKIWVKTWKRTDLNVTETPIEVKSFAGFQNFETKFGDHLYEHMTKFPDSTPYITNLTFNIAYGHESKIILQAPDAIHYQVYELAADNKYPLNLTAEFRINKASKCLLAPTYDEDPNAYYCLMEILSVNGTQGFLDFSIEIAKRWMEKYDAKPHWGKMWEHVP